MDPVDGNAIGGLLNDVFGADMTAATVTCGSCGGAGLVAGLTVWRQAPGTIARCRNCGNLLMVFVRAYGMTCVDLSGVADVS
jgi:ribosomal protein S27E